MRGMEGKCIIHASVKCVYSLMVDLEIAAGAVLVILLLWYESW